MNHLPVLKNSSPYPTVRYWGSRPFLRILFSDVPQHHGWNVNELRKGEQLQGHTPISTMGFLQDWLYFGLLFDLSHASGQSPPKETDFLHGPTPCLTSRLLDDFINTRVNAIAEMIHMQPQQQAALNHLEASLDTASQITRETEWLSSMQEVIISIMILGSTIDRAMTEYNLLDDIDRSWGLASRVVKPKMRALNWCPREISLTGSLLSEVSMFCASHLDRQYGTSRLADHTLCNDRVCEVNQIDKDKYMTQHATEGCSCALWPPQNSPTQETLINMIKGDKIPFIELSRTRPSDTDISASLESFDNRVFGNKRLFIISHVWSDGMGNRKENRLHMCQLRRLYGLIDNLPSWKKREAALGSTFRVWIDTLCIPVDDKTQRTRETRKTAINMLRRYFSYAQTTIVLDKSINYLRKHEFSQGELLLRVGLSSWMSRCWTMEEAVIAGNSVQIPFSDNEWLQLFSEVARTHWPNMIRWKNTMKEGQRKHIKMFTEMAKFIVDESKGTRFEAPLNLAHTVFGLAIDRHWQHKGTVITERPPVSTPTRLLQDSRYLFASMTILNAPPPSSGSALTDDENVRRVVHAWNSLSYRNTSKSQDRNLIFAYLAAGGRTDFDVAESMFKSDEQSLKSKDKRGLEKWYEFQRAVPCDLLFMKGEKLPGLGRRWAPADVHNERMESLNMAKCLADGSLSFQKHCFYFHPTFEIQWEHFCIRSSTGRLCGVKLDSSTRSKDVNGNTIALSKPVALILRTPLPKIGSEVVAAIVHGVSRKLGFSAAIFGQRAVLTVEPRDCGELDVVEAEYTDAEVAWHIS